MTQSTGGFAPEAPDQPGEFNAGPGFMAREKGVPTGLDPRRFTEKQRRAALVVPPLPVSASRKTAALRRTEPTDPNAEPDPFALGSG
jgi:hypothetical protein